MTRLFESTTVNGMRLKNRMIRSATWEGMCDERGRPTQKLIDCYVALARGGIGLIISGYAFVQSSGKQLPGKLGIDSDELAPDFRRLIDAVHAAGGRLAIQL
ncbi:MAG TPA: NADH:flavin oxidoreductase, partial [Gammaproteobacteria bacterium]|nr:NADH:flavin oxidoreductase [Gammaproteobacteria bacterium]